METTISRLTVFYEDPYWVGIFERESAGKLEACKITFGAEPKDSEVYEFLLQNWGGLRFSPSVESPKGIKGWVSPKRKARDVRKQVQGSGVGTKAQQALKLQQEQGKAEKKIITREERAAKEEQRFSLRQEKRKEKHKGH